jgi:N-formylglutamate amidohydrolase
MDEHEGIRDDSQVITGGRVPGGDVPAFRLDLPREIPLPVLISVPHAGRAYPSGLHRQMRSPDYSALRLEDRHVDSLAREVARQTGAVLLVAEAPRAMLDLNRAVDDIDWEMIVGGAPKGHRASLTNRRSRSGLGLVPRRLPGLGEIWNRRITPEELTARIEGIHRPYHGEIARVLETIRDRWGAALLLDLHSMPPLSRRFPAEQAAEFVIGDRFGASCDPVLAARGLEYFAQSNRPVAHNRPYAGGYVLDRHAQPQRGMHAIQVEVCRATYLDARLADPSARLPAVAKLLAGLVRDLAACTATLGRGGAFALAAE